ncbi:MAG: hypothetical protein MJZ20_05945 [Bacteroidaceae bacterium]|nr:hypothetical protein [Bacteroidaceae bacterium]
MGDIILFNAFGFVPVLRVSLRLPWAMNRLAFQAASGEVRRRKTKVKIARNEFSTNRMQSQTCLNYAEVRQKMQELNL